jgi:hypothetical protein
MGRRVLADRKLYLRMLEDARRDRPRRGAFPNMLPAGRQNLIDTKRAGNVGEGTFDEAEMRLPRHFVPRNDVQNIYR